MDKIYDSIIIGAGPAGITASIYAARKGMDILMLTGDIGGQAAWSGDIENYSGYQFITGTELTKRFEEHLKEYKVQVNENETVKEIQKKGETFSVITAKDTYKAKTVIIATGKRSKNLSVPGEQEFRNKGVAYCATCDAPLFKGKEVAVAGGGNSALEAALQLLSIAKHVYIVNINPQLGGDEVIREKVTAADNVTVMNNSQITSVFGDKLVEGIEVASGSDKKKVAVQGVFVEIGLIPNSDFKSELKKNEYGEIIVNCESQTNVPGIFAAGDVSSVKQKQIIIAAGDGAKAALGAFMYLAQRK